MTIPPLVLNPDHTFGLAALEPGSRPPSLELSAAAAMQQQPQQQPHSARSVGSARGDHLVQGQASRQQRSPGALRQASARPSAAQLQALGQHSSQDLQPWLSSPRSVRPLYRQPSPRHSAAAAALSPSHSRSRGRRQQQPQSARGGSPGGVTVVVHGEQTPFGWAAVDEPAAGAAPAPPPSRIP